MEVFCQRLRRLREDQGLSQRALSELCGLSHGAISLYENGKAVPTAFVLGALADVFNVSADYLLGRDSYLTRG